MPNRKADGDPVPPNADGIEPPAACFLPRKPDFPEVATPSVHNQEAQLNALLIEPSELCAAICELILESDTLKAWFAYRMCSAGECGKHISAKWKNIEYLLVNSDSPLSAEFQELNGDFHVHNIGLDGSEFTKFHARAVFTLMRRIQDNPTRTKARGERLRCHPYYQTQLQKCFLAYRFLSFLIRYTRKASPFSIFRPTAQRKVEAWEESPQGKIGAACEAFIEGKLEIFVAFGCTCLISHSPGMAT